MAPRTQGFTLVELVVGMAVSVVVVAFVALFISSPVQGFADQSRRAKLVDAADTALRRMSRDVRRALPNSIRTTTNGNVVALELLGTMEQATRMSEEGATYRNAFVVDSLCCPSRTSIFTGRPPHLTRVLTNGAERVRNPLGGFRAFREHGNVDRSFNVALRRSGAPLTP